MKMVLFPRFPCKSKNRLNNSLILTKRLKEIGRNLNEMKFKRKASFEKKAIKVQTTYFVEYVCCTGI